MATSEPMFDRFGPNAGLVEDEYRAYLENPAATSSVSLGFRCDPEFERTVRFANDPAITRLDIDGTCERCRLTIEECQDRVSPPTLLVLQQTRNEIEQELASLTSGGTITPGNPGL